MPVMGQQPTMLAQAAAPLTGAQPTMMTTPHSNVASTTGGIMQPTQATLNGANKSVLDPFGAL